LYCIFFRPTDKSDENVHTGFLKEAARSEQICRPENPPTPHGNPPPGSLMAPPINGVSPSLQNDGIIRHPAIAFAHQGKTTGGFADPAFTKEQNAETPNPDEHSVDHDLPLAPLPEQAGQTAVEQRIVVARRKDGRLRPFRKLPKKTGYPLRRQGQTGDIPEE
jgi:hypothetical protein